jgi:hypothetical protein
VHHKLLQYLTTTNQHLDCVQLANNIRERLKMPLVYVHFIIEVDRGYDMICQQIYENLLLLW